MITTTIQSNVLIPGAYSQIEYRSIAEGVIPVDEHVVIVATKTAAGTAVADTPHEVVNDVDADTKFGVGSEAATLARWARAQGAYLGRMPRLSVVGVVEPVGAKTAKTLTCTLTAPQAGNFKLEIGRHLVVVGVTTADTSATFAASLKNEIDKLKLDCAITAGVATNVVTCTATCNGENGNDLPYAIAEAPAGVVVVIATGTPGSGVLAITNALASLYDKNYAGVAPSNHKTADVALALVDLALAWSPGTENFRFYYFGETGSIGTVQALQAAANTEKILFPSHEGGKFTPAELGVGVMIAAHGFTKPNQNLNGVVIRLPACPPAFAYTGGPSGEQQLLLASGITPLVPDGNYIKIVRLITSIKTVAGIPFSGTRDLAYPRTAAWLARQIAYRYVLSFSDRNQDAELLQDVRDMVIAVHRAAEKAEILRDVETYVPQIIVEESTEELGRTVLSDPFRVAGPAHQLFGKHVMLF